MKVTVLIENTAPENLVCEHGLSFLIEFEQQKYLLDAGSTDLFLENAKRLGVYLKDVKTCILSHGHYDHSGGFHTFLNENKEAYLYLMKSADEEYYSTKGELHEIGIPKVLLASHKERFIRVEKTIKLKENVYLIPHNAKDLDLIGKRAGLYKKVGKELSPDDFAHEMSLVFDTQQGLVIFNSCSHAGVKNIISEVQNVLPGKLVYAFIGGLHMKGTTFSKEEIQEIAILARKAGMRLLYTGHCTGEEAYKILKEADQSLIQQLTSGIEIVL